MLMITKNGFDAKVVKLLVLKKLIKMFSIASAL